MPEEYQVALTAGPMMTYQSATIVATDNIEAEQKARQWTNSVDFPANAWLVINLKGFGVCTLPPGSF